MNNDEKEKAVQRFTTYGSFTDQVGDRVRYVTTAESIFGTIIKIHNHTTTITIHLDNGTEVDIGPTECCTTYLENVSLPLPLIQREIEIEYMISQLTI